MSRAGIRPRAYELPEFATYRDTGCEISSRCAPDKDGNGGCPLERCKYDMPGDLARRQVSQARARRAKEMFAAGMQSREIAAALGISQRRVFFLKGETK